MSPHIVFCDPKESVWKLHCSLWKEKCRQNIFLIQKIRTVLRAAGLLSRRPLPSVCREVHLVQVFSLFTFCTGYQEETNKYFCLPHERCIPATKLLLPAQKVMEATIHSYWDTSPNDLLIIQAGTKSAWLHQTGRDTDQTKERSASTQHLQDHMWNAPSLSEILSREITTENHYDGEGTGEVLF